MSEGSQWRAWKTDQNREVWLSRSAVQMVEWYEGEHHNKGLGCNVTLDGRQEAVHVKHSPVEVVKWLEGEDDA